MHGPRIGAAVSAAASYLPRSIVQAPDDRLTRKCEPVTVFDDDLVGFAVALGQARADRRGLGLAANQVGDHRRVISLNPGQTCGFRTMVNPEIIKHGGNQSWGSEGCLSIDGGTTLYRVKRWDTITVRFQTTEGETKEVLARGLGARVIQHEIDHLNGKLISEGNERVAMGRAAA